MRGPTVEGRPGDATHLRTCVDNCGEAVGESDRASFAWPTEAPRSGSGLVPTTTLAGELTALRKLHAATKVWDCCCCVGLPVRGTEGGRGTVFARVCAERVPLQRRARKKEAGYFCVF